MSGHADGSLSLWKGRSPNVRKQVHKKAVNTLYTCTDATAAFISGGTDGLIVLWNMAFEPVKQFDLKLLPKAPIDPEIRSICALQSFVLIGTKSSEIIELNTVNGETDV